VRLGNRRAGPAGPPRASRVSVVRVIVIFLFQPPLTRTSVSALVAAGHHPMPACDIRLWTGPECWHPGRVDWLQSSYSGAEVLAGKTRSGRLPDSRVQSQQQHLYKHSTCTSSAVCWTRSRGDIASLSQSMHHYSVRALQHCSSRSSLVARSIMPIY